jgi:hypothetical protein
VGPRNPVGLPINKAGTLGGYQVSSVTEATAQLPAKGSSTDSKIKEVSRARGILPRPSVIEEALEKPDKPQPCKLPV